MTEHKKHLVIKPLIWGISGTILLFGIYFITLTALNSAAHAWQQFILFWPWMSILIIGFGFQVGMFAYLKGYKKIQLATGTSTTTVVATGSVSTGSMVACCLHHASDILPIIGLSAASVFLSKYQTFFLAIGAVSNAVGTTFMLYIIQKHNLYLAGGILERIQSWNMKKIMYITLFAGIIGLTVLLIYTLQR